MPSGVFWTLEYPYPQHLTTGGSLNSSLLFSRSSTLPSQLTTEPLSSSGLIVFDYDGVLVDSCDAMIHATNAFCRSHGIKPTIDSAAFDTLDPVTFVAVARAASIPESLTSAYARYLFHEFRAAPEQSPIFPGIPELLENLGRCYTIAIVSANHTGVIRKRLQVAGLEQHVFLLVGNETEGTKFDHIQFAMAQTGHSQERTWSIGDTVSDIDAAQAAGAHALAITWGWQTRAFLASRAPEQLFDTITEVEQYLLGI